jgi:hypothetical protein
VGRINDVTGLKKWRVRVAAFLVVIVAVVVAFMSSGASAREAAGAPGQSEGVYNYVAYTNGHAGKANPKLAPYYIGYMNTEGGSIPPLGEGDSGRPVRCALHQ